jgi:MFS family permease
LRFELLGLTRVLQGLGGAMLLPVGRLSVLRAFPRDQFLQAMSVVAIPGLVGPLIGPTLGGWLVQYATWHWIFLINLPVGVIGFFATLKFMPLGRIDTVKPFDFGGYLLLAFGMVSISLSLDGLSGLGLRQASVLVLLVFGMASLVAYWLRAARLPDPLFPPALFAIPSMSIGLLGNLFARLGSACMPFLIPLLLQVSMGYAPSEAGMMMLPDGAWAGQPGEGGRFHLLRRHAVLAAGRDLRGRQQGLQPPHQQAVQRAAAADDQALRAAAHGAAPRLRSARREFGQRGLHVAGAPWRKECRCASSQGRLNRSRPVLLGGGRAK